MQPAQLQEGHRSHAEMLLKALQQAAPSGRHFTAEGIEADRLSGVLPHPPLRRLHSSIRAGGRASRCRGMASRARASTSRGIRSRASSRRVLAWRSRAGSARPGRRAGAGRSAPSGAPGVHPLPVAPQHRFLQPRTAQLQRPLQKPLPIQAEQRQAAVPGGGEVDLPRPGQAEEGRGRQRNAMGAEAVAARLLPEIEGDQLPIPGLGTPAVEGLVEAQPQQLHRSEIHRQHLRLQGAARELGELHRQHPAEGLLHPGHIPDGRRRSGSALFECSVARTLPIVGGAVLQGRGDRHRATADCCPPSYRLSSLPGVPRHAQRPTQHPDPLGR